MMDEAASQSLTLESLLTVLQGFREEDRGQRKEELAQLVAAMTKSQEQVRQETRLEFTAELRKMREEIGTLRSQVMGATTFAERVFNETEFGKPDQQIENPAPKSPPPSVGISDPKPCTSSTPPRQSHDLTHQAPLDARRDTLLLPAGSMLSKPCAQSTPPLQPSTAATQTSSNTCRDSCPASSPFWSAARPAVMPAEYDGRTPWKRYALQFEAVSRANGWPSELKSTYLVTFLRGTALAFFETLDSHTREDYSQLSKAFQSRFGVDHQRTVAHIQLRSRVQGTRESFAEFATDVQRLTHLTFSDCPEGAKDRIALEQFLDGIADLDIQERVRDSDPQTLQAALQSAVRIEASHRATRASRRQIRAATVQASISNRRRPTRHPNRQESRVNQAIHSTKQSGNEDGLA